MVVYSDLSTEAFSNVFISSILKTIREMISESSDKTSASSLTHPKSAFLHTFFLSLTLPDVMRRWQNAIYLPPSPSTLRMWRVIY